MRQKHFILLPRAFWFTQAFCLFLLAPAFSQTPCSNPIILQSVTVLNSTCGNTTGAIVLTVTGGNNGLQFNWTPNVPGANAIFDIPADVYRVRITRDNNANCKLDTTILVNNSDGPPAQVISVKPANCFALNGQLTLAPNNLNYLWSNSESGAVNDSLSSGCYTITATAANGCYSVLQACVPNVNTLQVTAALLKPAKCGKANGKVGLTITGGTGNYDYCLGNGSPTLNNLAAGSYTCTITDKVTGCKAQTSFTVPAANPQALVKLSTYNVKCPGNNDGFVVFSIEPAANFELPYTFLLKNASSGASASPGSLAPGLYDLTIMDADGCPLPPASFLISAPPPFLLQTSQTPPTCAQPGQLLVSPSGGNGKFIFDWADLPGTNNGKDRFNIEAGVYSATIYDSLFCQYPLAPITVPSLCNKADTLFRVLPVNASDTICLPLPTGVNQGAFALYGKSVSGSSSFGSWTLRPEGCLLYKAKSNPGYALDTICVQAITGINGLNKSWCIVVSLTTEKPVIDTVYFTVQLKASATACGNIPTNFTNTVITRTNGKSLAGSSGSFGTYAIHPTNGCLTFKSIGQPGYFVDKICINVYDRVLRKSKMICYIPSVLPLADCLPAIGLPDTLQLNVQDCTDFASACLHIPFTEISTYAIIDNGASYASGFGGCEVEDKTAYATSQLPSGGPFTLVSWSVGTQTFGGVFANATGLTALMNQLDPDGQWALRNNNTLIVGGKSGKIYGNIKISTNQGSTSTLTPLKEPVARGTQMRFSAGLHRLTFRQFNTGCIDTLYVRVRCSSCPPVHVYNTDSQGLIRWETKNCKTDTVFCTTIPTKDLSRYAIKDNGRPFFGFTTCGATIGFELDTGYHVLTISDAQAICQYKINFLLQCPMDIPLQSRSIVLKEGEEKTICIDTSQLGGSIATFASICPAKANGHAKTALNKAQKCLTLTGLNFGKDTVCIQLCNKLGGCGEYQYFVSVVPKEDSISANPDFFYTSKNKSVTGALLNNDVFDAAPVVSLSGQPQHGQLSFNASGEIEYTPNQNYCGLDTFRYSLQSRGGSIASALVSIRIICDKILIFNGISPNGDGDNDVWHLPGIDQYPNNKVNVFNRWGNLVFKADGYSNQTPWEGQWDGRDLPDGTYYYVIDLGDGSDVLSGYLQIRR